MNGAFLEREGPWEKHDFELVDVRPLSVEEVEFPCWFDDMDSGLYFCRGQLRQKLSRRELGPAVESWDVLQTPLNPLLLRRHLLGEGLDSSARFGDGDLRYSPHLGEVVARLGLDLSVPYWRALQSSNPSALRRCEAALSR